MYGKSNMGTYITVCEIDGQWKFAVWLKELKQGLCDNLEGWDGKKMREVQELEVMGVPMADSCWCFTGKKKSVKQLSFNSKINNMAKKKKKASQNSQK